MNNRFQQHHISKNIIFQRATDYKKQQIFKNNTEQQTKKEQKIFFKKITDLRKTPNFKKQLLKKNIFQKEQISK